MVNPVVIEEGEGPVLLAMPHSGTFVPPDIFAHLNPIGQALADTDWHVDKLYESLGENCTRVKAQFHRYVVDANRSPDDGNLYPGQNSTGLVPLSDFEGREIWQHPPDKADKAKRLQQFHHPYHQALHAQLARIKKRHGIALLFDCHSIRSEIAFLFEGRLPDLNIGTHDGKSCAVFLQEAAEKICHQSPYTSVVNGRFKGGWTTRHYGRPETGIHAIQLEIAQAIYLQKESAPWEIDPEKLQKLRKILQSLLHTLQEKLSHEERPL